MASMPRSCRSPCTGGVVDLVGAEHFHSEVWEAVDAATATATLTGTVTGTGTGTATGTATASTTATA
jgi:hypothetical protein